MCIYFIYVCMSVGVCIYTYGYILVCFSVFPLFFSSFTLISHFHFDLRDHSELFQPLLILLMLFISVCSHILTSTFARLSEFMAKKPNYLTLTRLGFLRVVFSGGSQFDPPRPLLFQEELI